MIYITTSRKPSVLSRRLVKQLARMLRAESENRGKRSVAETLERAQAKGYTRCMLVYEEHGNPSKLSFLEKGEWLPSISIKNASFAVGEEKERRRLPGLWKIHAKDAVGEQIAALFETPQASEKMGETLGGVEMHASSSEISFSFEGKKVGPTIKVRGIEQPQKIDSETEVEE